MGDDNWASDEIRYGPTIAQQRALIETLGVGPTPDQWRVLEARARKKLVAGGERGGKSFYSGLELTTRILWGKLFWLIGADYSLARPEFEYVAEWLTDLGAIANPKRDISMPKYGMCYLRTKTGQVVETKTADDVRKIAARAPDGIVLCEAAQLSYDVLLKAVGRLAEKRGWLVASGTFEGSSGWYPELFDEWRGLNNDGGRSFSLPTWGNTKVFPGGRNDSEILRLERTYSKVPGLFDERCGAVPAPPSNIVFSQFRDTIHIDERAVYDPALPVFLAIDPSGGTNPYAVGAYQFHEIQEYVPDDEAFDAKQFAYLIDRVYERGKIDEEMIELTIAKPWWDHVAGGAIDVEAPDSKKRWLKLAGINLWSKKVEQIEGIRRLQSFMYYKKREDGSFEVPPHLLVNPDVVEFSYEVRNYKRIKVGSVTGRSDRSGLERVPKEKPPSDQPNHILKATWYLLIARYGYVKSPIKRRPVRTWRNPLRVRSLK